ncbi:probable ATP-dependent RNA helicase DDX43 [Diabrotica virgifera virgifera]|uniref:RNA helicase n=1 Tax=Diabrotica virgifera virgifera TaxID=50390 RepID=A0A6P7G540_DIAVI|nr:probable ATP-dependent RNA helicase DDX43 [Diabrotica virgifera virgifera]XP_050510856.1 probable ATP-dependent RNA helicase DDX43 [Diabrotica virgifera virgifera]XP_050510863.1 probable ATP-dependent RNA helicase DDX43 [Diabrotica virgifera virgifera]
MDDCWDDNPDPYEQPANPAFQYNTNTQYNANGWNQDRPQQNFRRGNSREQNTNWRQRDGRERRPDRDGRDRKPDREGRERRSDENSESLTVESKYVGRIIGRQGSKIASLQEESGARINIDKNSFGEETEIKISGDAAAIQKAKELIMELTTERKSNYEQNNQPREEPKQEMDLDTFLKQCEEAEKAEWEKYPPTVKEFYKEHPQITKMSQKEVDEFRLNSNNTMVSRVFQTETSLPVPKPCTSFYFAFHQYPDILELIKEAGFTQPSPIQCQAWPVLLSGEDLIGIAQTGTGKTLAFLLPALIHIEGQITPRNERTGPAVLVMAPTRELALQIDNEVKKYKYRGITSVCVYGGGNRRSQIDVVKKGIDIVIATPGRLNDLHDAGHLNVKYVTYVVLDEADRMLDMGFEPQIRRVMYAVRPNRQTVMTSATWPNGVKRLALSYMKDPIQVSIGALDLTASHTVHQTIVILQEEEKRDYFYNFVRNMGEDDKIIVFCGKKAAVTDITSDLQVFGVNCDCLYGDKPQEDREQAYLDIKSGVNRLLIATDLASRGLDIDDVTHVVNYDIPKNIEEYVHRIGRTGRAGKYGESISYFTRRDWSHAAELIKILEEAQQFVPEELREFADGYAAWKERKDREGPARGGGFRGGRGGGGRRW